MSSLVWKRALARAWPGPAASRQLPRRAILLYHGVGSAATATPAAAFAQQMQWLAAHTRVVSLDSLLLHADPYHADQPHPDQPHPDQQHPDQQHPQPPRVALTFDDGYASVASTAAPLLRDLGLPATVYLNTGCIGDSTARRADPALGHSAGESFMTWAQVQALHAQGWTVGSHGVEHVDLTALDSARTAAQLAQSRCAIEARLGSHCTHFAYTWGRCNRRVRQAVADAGYSHAVAALHGPVTPRSDPHALPRIHVAQRYSLADFAAIVSGDWDFLAWVQRARALAQLRA